MSNLPKIEDFVDLYLDDMIFVNKLDVPDIMDIQTAIREYAKLAIIADRENIAEHALSEVQYESTGSTIAVVDKDSIINAPNIELL